MLLSGVNLCIVTDIIITMRMNVHYRKHALLAVAAFSR
jgi:hypothetical protein